MAYGHQDFEKFTYACRYHNMFRPGRVKHTYHRSVWIKPEKGDSYQTTEYCDKFAKDSKPITVGYM